MTIVAHWADLDPKTSLDRDVHEMRLATSKDVRALVDMLAMAHTSEAHVIHDGRPIWHDSILDDDGPDHQVVVAVWRGFGYMEYIDPTHWSQIVGDPKSPEWHTTNQEHFHAGTGVALNTLVEAVSEFLTTGERPTCVQWRERDSGRFTP